MIDGLIAQRLKVGYPGTRPCATVKDDLSGALQSGMRMPGTRATEADSSSRRQSRSAPWPNGPRASRCCCICRAFTSMERPGPSGTGRRPLLAVVPRLFATHSQRPSRSHRRSCEGAERRNTTRSGATPVAPSAAATHQALASAAVTRTPTGCCANTSPKERTVASIARTNGMRLPTHRTRDHARLAGWRNTGRNTRPTARTGSDRRCCDRLDPPGICQFDIRSAWPESPSHHRPAALRKLTTMRLNALAETINGSFTSGVFNFLGPSNSVSRAGWETTLSNNVLFRENLTGGSAFPGHPSSGNFSMLPRQALPS